jgi:hypothetical protein
MSDKNFRKEDIHDLFRPDETMMLRHGFPDHLKEPGYIYKRVIYKTASGFYKNDPFHVQKQLDKGWELVYEEGQAAKRKPNQVEIKENLRPDPIRYISPDGNISFFMRITKEAFHKYQLEKAKATKAKTQSSVISKGKGHEEDKEQIDLNEMAGVIRGT